MIYIWLLGVLCLFWFIGDFDELVVTHNEVVLKNITEDLQNLPHLPTEAMFNLEHLAMQKVS